MLYGMEYRHLEAVDYSSFHILQVEVEDSDSEVEEEAEVERIHCIHSFDIPLIFLVQIVCDFQYLITSAIPLCNSRIVVLSATGQPLQAFSQPLVPLL